MNNTNAPVIAALNNKIVTRKDMARTAPYILKMLLTFLIVLFVTRYLFPTGRIDGASNEPTLMESDIAVFNSFDKNYAVGKMVDFRGAGALKGMLINKRITATAGDLVEIDNATGELQINGKVIVPASENYAPPMELIDTPTIVPEGYVFVLGDNRTASMDSRYKKMGLVSTDSIKGTLLFRIPLSGLFDS